MVPEKTGGFPYWLEKEGWASAGAEDQRGLGMCSVAQAVLERWASGWLTRACIEWDQVFVQWADQALLSHPSSEKIELEVNCILAFLHLAMAT